MPVSPLDPNLVPPPQPMNPGFEVTPRLESSHPVQTQVVNEGQTPPPENPAQSSLVQNVPITPRETVDPSAYGGVTPGGAPRLNIHHEESIGIEAGGKHVNIPTVVDGKKRTDEEAIQMWRDGKNPEHGTFNSREEADEAARIRSNTPHRATAGPRIIEYFSEEPDEKGWQKVALPDKDDPAKTLPAWRNVNTGEVFPRAHVDSDPDQDIFGADPEFTKAFISMRMNIDGWRQSTNIEDRRGHAQSLYNELRAAPSIMLDRLVHGAELTLYDIKALIGTEAATIKDISKIHQEFFEGAEATPLKAKGTR